MMNIHLWHGGTLNKTGKLIRTICINYRWRSLPQLLNQKQFLSPATMNKLTPEERYLLAVRDNDEIQTEPAVGVAAMYAEAYGLPIRKPE